MRVEHLLRKVSKITQQLPRRVVQDFHRGVKIGNVQNPPAIAVLESQRSLAKGNQVEGETMLEFTLRNKFAACLGQLQPSLEALQTDLLVARL